MKITVIGAGAMGGTTAEGLLKQKDIEVQLTVSDPVEATRKRFADMGASVTADNAAAAKDANVVFVVVKPWLTEQVLRGIAPVMTANQILVVIAAGVKSESIKEWIKAPLLLAIPNIAIAQLASMTFLVPVTSSDEQTATVKRLFDAMGQTVITEEKMLGAGTTLASCGIAYAMRYVRAASEGGVELGFRADVAKQIVMQTMLGAVELLQATGMHPEQAIDQVTTPGGVTIKGLNAMEEAGFTTAVIKGLKAGAKS